MEIRRVELAKLTASDFLKEYFEPEIPVVLTGVTEQLQTSTDNLTRLLGQILGANRARTNKTWFQTDSEFFEEKIGTPGIVSACLEGSRSYRRIQNLRIWVNLGGHETPFHADVNGLFVFNYQVAGQKRWQIVHPDTKIGTHAFTQIVTRKYNRAFPSRLNSSLMEFDLLEGEMLFLPPYWYHRVLSLGELNLNVNWVGTKKKSRPNKLSIRESEIMKALFPIDNFHPVRRVVDLLVGTKEKNYFANYAGNGGAELIKLRITGISTRRAICRVFRELMALPRLAWEWGTIRGYQTDPTKVLREIRYIEKMEGL